MINIFFIQQLDFETAKILFLMVNVITRLFVYKNAISKKLWMCTAKLGPIGSEYTTPARERIYISQEYKYENQTYCSYI
jgi:hypothetical protein